VNDAFKHVMLIAYRVHLKKIGRNCKQEWRRYYNNDYI